MQHFTISDQVLDQGAYIETPNVSGSITPRYAIIYATPMSEKEAIAAYSGVAMTMKSSTHLLINYEGKVTQFAPFTAKTWHAGASYWQGYHGLNSCAIGITLVGYADPQRSRHSSMEATGLQLETLDELLPVLVKEYNLRDIVPGYAINSDTHPYWDYPETRYQSLVRLGNADSIGRFAVTSPINLNVRGGPDAAFEVIDTLAPGEGIKVLRLEGSWAFITYERRDGLSRQGWVHESFLRRL